MISADDSMTADGLMAADGAGARPTTEAEARAAGFRRCFVADEPRLSEAVETYEELGLEVLLVPVHPGEEGCSECMRQDPERYRVIYTRARSAPRGG